MSAHKRSTGRASEFAGAADKIVHFARRIARGDTAYVREPMLDLIEQCLLGNKEIILRNAALQENLDSDEMEIVVENLEYACRNIRRIEPGSGRERRVTMMALPVSIHGITATDMTVPDALADIAPLRELLIQYGAPAQGLFVSPALHDPEDLENLGYCEVYRLLHDMAPQELVVGDPIVAPETPAVPKPKPVSLPAGIAVNLDRIILCAWVMSDDEWPPFLEEELADRADNLGNIGALAKQLGLDVYAYVPIPLQDAIADQQNLRPGKKLMTDLLFKLATGQLDASQFQAHISIRIQSGEIDTRLAEAIDRGDKGVEIPIAPPIIEISVRHKHTDAILHETDVHIEEAMDLEAVANGILIGLHSAGVDLGDEHKADGS